MGLNNTATSAGWDQRSRFLHYPAGVASLTCGCNIVKNQGHVNDGSTSEALSFRSRGSGFSRRYGQQNSTNAEIEGTARRETERTRVGSLSGFRGKSRTESTGWRAWASPHRSSLKN